MKKSVLIIAALLISSFLKAQTGPVEELINKYSGRDGYTYISVSSKMLGMLANLDSESEKTNNILFRLRSIKILSQDSLCTDKVDFYAELSKKLDFSAYEELMVVKESHEVTKFLAKQNGNIITELLMITGGTNSNAIISIKGEFSLKEISNLSNTLGMDELDKLENLEHKDVRK